MQGYISTLETLDQDFKAFILQLEKIRKECELVKIFFEPLALKSNVLLENVDKLYKLFGKNEQ